MKIANRLSVAAVLLMGGSAGAQQAAVPIPAAPATATTVPLSRGSYQAFAPDGKAIPPQPPLASWTRTLQPLSLQNVHSYRDTGNCRECHRNDQQSLTLQNPHSYGWAFPYPQMAKDGIGADLIQADFSLRAPLNLPNDRGLVVTDVVTNGPAAMVGLQNNDILLTLFDKPLNKPEDFLAVLEAARKGTPAPHSASLTLLRAGKPITLSVVAVSKVGLAPMPAEPTPEYFIGVRTSTVDETLRSHLTLPAGTGVVVLEVVADSPAAKAGLIAGDILLDYAAKPLPSAEALRELIQADGTKKATMTVFRKGSEIKLAVTPEKRKPEPTANIGFEVKVLDKQEQLLVEMQKAIGATNQNFVLDFVGTNPGQKLVVVNPDEVNLSKKIDDLNAQIQALSKAIEELRKEKK